jgi:hypothetical protein
MLTRRIKKAFLLGLFLYLPFVSMAWGLLGHRIVGEIADSYLTRHTRKEIFKILGTESVAMASNWADFIKSDPSQSYLSPWHYCDFRGGMNAAEFKAALDADTVTDAYTKINFLVTELKNKELATEKKAMYLRLLIHIVGDVHQPLHVGRPEDQGGNKIKVMWFGVSYNLHSIWDNQLINFQQLSYTEYADAINHTTRDQLEAWKQQPLSEWLWESYQLAGKVYADITQADQKLDYKYNYDYLALLNQQLLKGGVHLAGLLTEIFKR